MRKYINLLGIILFLFIKGSAYSQIAKNVTLLDNWTTNVSIVTPDGLKFNDVWGFENNGKEYAVMGSTMGGHLFEITEDEKLNEVGFIPSRSLSILSPAVHRDYKTYRNYLYCVSDEVSGLQIVDLNFLPDSVNIVYSSSTLLKLVHNIYIDTAKAMMYACGHPDINGNYYGVAVFSLADPVNPQLMSTISMDYVHDAYVRNDTAYFNCALDGIYVYKFDNGTNPQLLNYLDYYPDQGFNHSGWLNGDGRYYVFADETKGKRIKMCDVSDLSDITVVSLFNSSDDTSSIVHNLMWKDEYIYVSHYYEGLQVFDARNKNDVKRIAWYDRDSNDSYFFNGAWGVYPFLKNNKVLISDRGNGLFLLRVNLPPSIDSPLEHGIYPNPGNGEMYFYYETEITSEYTFMVYNELGQLIYQKDNIEDNYHRFDVSDWASGGYFYQWEGIENSVHLTGKFIVTGK